ncbi:MAG: hypothetical protein WAO98_03490 [Alphaproteobacteria bacterium]
MSKKDFPGSDLLAFASRSKDSESKQKPNKVLSALEKARVSYHVTDRMQGYGLKPLKDNELRSIYSLFAWVANEQSAAEETVQSMTEAYFNVVDVKEIKQKNYDEVIQFLVDLRIDEMKH